MVICAVKIIAVEPLPTLDNPSDEVLLNHYKHLPYHLRHSAHAISSLFNQSINDNRGKPIINAAGEKFDDFNAYKEELDEDMRLKFEVIRDNDTLKGQPDWVYANPYMLFFGVFF